MALLKEAIQTDPEIQSGLNDARQENGALDLDKAIQLIAENLAFPEQAEIICELEETDKLELQDAIAEKLRSESDRRAEQAVEQAQIDPEIGGNLNQMKTGEKLNIKKAAAYLIAVSGILGSAYLAKLILTPEPEPKKGYRAGAEVKRVRGKIAYKARIQREARDAAEARTEYIGGLQGEAKIRELAKDNTDYSINAIPPLPNVIRQIREGQRTIESLTENELAEILGFKQSIEGDPNRVVSRAGRAWIGDTAKAAFDLTDETADILAKRGIYTAKWTRYINGFGAPIFSR